MMRAIFKKKMDQQTARFYQTEASSIAARYEAVASPVERYFASAFTGGNDLWNLVPVDSEVNLNKSDKLPARELLWERQPVIVRSWEVLRDRMPMPFDQQAETLLGKRLNDSSDWQATLFGRLSDAIEMTAVQRGVVRWRPRPIG